jgi:hypothetical protein
MPELPFPTTATAPKTPAPAPAATATPPAEEKTGGGEVVRLDRFRKK